MNTPSARLDWTIIQRMHWVATHNESGSSLVASTKALLMSKINLFDKEQA